MTRLPIPLSWQGGDAVVFAKVPQAFMFVGLFVGVCSGGFAWLCCQVLSPEISAVMTFAFTLVLTGCLHEDGLADVADSMGGWGRERRFEIMRDSRIGTYGTLALVVSSVLKISCFAVLLKSPFYAWGVFIVASGFGRWSAALLMRCLPYLKNRTGGVGIGASMLVPSTRVLTVQFCLVFIGIIIFWIQSPFEVCGLLAVFAAVLLLVIRYFKKAFGGITGDCLGATVVLIELSVYLWAVAGKGA